MGGLDEISAYVIMTEGLMAPQPIHGIDGMAELSYGTKTLRASYMISMEHAILLQLDIPLMLDIVFRIPTEIYHF